VVLIAPIEEAFYRARVGHPGIAVADGRGKEFDEAEAGAFAPGLRSAAGSASSPARTSAGGGMTWLCSIN
jgi:hypothetical protein